MGCALARRGHAVRLGSPEYFRPASKAWKNDDRDAEATAYHLDAEFTEPAPPDERTRRLLTISGIGALNAIGRRSTPCSAATQCNNA